MGKKKTTGAVWVLAEPKDQTLQPVSLQLLGKARAIADQLDVAVEVVLLGENLSDLAELLIGYGADAVYAADSPELALYQPELYSEILVKIATEKEPDILLIGSTFIGRELAPIVAAKLKTGLTAHCIDLVVEKNEVLDQQIPAYGGLISILCPEKRPQMATVAGGVFVNPEFNQSRDGKIINLPVSEMIEGVEQKLRIVELIKEENDEISLDSAQFIVAGGAGAGDIDGWTQIKKLSENLSAALGCTRPAVDEGWAELETMIGQSGKMVSPQFYLGVGLSGELQHMVGIKGAQMMIAINNDKKSPVFEQVDYGIVEDCKTFIPMLIEKIENR